MGRSKRYDKCLCGIECPDATGDDGRSSDSFLTTHFDTVNDGGAIVCGTNYTENIVTRMTFQEVGNFGNTPTCSDRSWGFTQPDGTIWHDGYDICYQSWNPQKGIWEGVATVAPGEADYAYTMEWESWPKGNTPLALTLPSICQRFRVTDGTAALTDWINVGPSTFYTWMNAIAPVYMDATCEMSGDLVSYRSVLPKAFFQWPTEYTMTIDAADPIITPFATYSGSFVLQRGRYLPFGPGWTLCHSFFCAPPDPPCDPCATDTACQCADTWCGGYWIHPNLNCCEDFALGIWQYAYSWIGPAISSDPVHLWLGFTDVYNGQLAALGDDALVYKPASSANFDVFGTSVYSHAFTAAGGWLPSEGFQPPPATITVTMTGW